MSVCIIAYLAYAINIWNQAKRKAKNYVIFILGVSILYTILLTVGLFLPFFSLPMYTVLLNVGNMLTFGCWWT